ncbi:hypothetical protein [Aquimarina sp. I32.4]|uniref:hypothetical protein n=1 Tax=Aquimarina sp. I32.4 TaxID=2053903 RepID=UPI000CDEC352|nr:hypothetical protein [Aquimarina sp. I32.4]
MKKILIIILVSFLFTNCNSQIAFVSIEKKDLKEPIKILYSSKNYDNAFIYVLYPLNVIIKNSSSKDYKLSNFYIGGNSPKGINLRDFKRYLLINDKISLFKKEILIKSKQELSLDIYCGVKLNQFHSSVNKKLTNSSPSQILNKSVIFNLDKNDYTNIILKNNSIDLEKYNLYFNFYNVNTDFYKSIGLSN